MGWAFADDDYATWHTVKGLTFILMQNNRILSASESPLMLDATRLDTTKSWKIIAGVRDNGYGTREIIGPVALYVAQDKPSEVWWITSPIDGYRRLVGKTGTSFEIIKDRLRTLLHSGSLKDYANLAKVELLEGAA